MSAQTSNGRSQHTLNAVGLCLNTIPVRVKLNPTWSPLDLMVFLQGQHRDSVDHELLGFRDIVERSTSWPKGTTFQSNIVHQNTDPDVPFAFGRGLHRLRVVNVDQVVMEL
ncbi:uncharacterized protein CDV56_105182 [Aspergillus thermomutatus]|uniref:Condensation domain-containing protein n=1 Tax=Aspergillus thermomutatus TaxID=41047 RepID=A0A397GWY9_ASPTH|nr:uncharacterized protein CDV56_105182 [Aspergillus thermomutatus]RHZ53573.1 hypothetical protein CDV56_105182 [Aspergillus thermomutatus]